MNGEKALSVEQSVARLCVLIETLNERIADLLGVLQGLSEIFDASGKGYRIKGLYVTESKKLGVDYEDET